MNNRIAAGLMFGMLIHCLGPHEEEDDMDAIAFQDQMEDNNCYGCGAHNPNGLHIKSYWDGPDQSICTYHPAPHQCAGPPQFLNGGVIATLMDCHSVCTSIADAYRRAGRAIGSQPAIWYVTGTLTVKYLRPTPLTGPVIVRAKLVEVKEKKTVVHCVLTSGGETCATGEVVAIRVPLAWRATVEQDHEDGMG